MTSQLLLLPTAWNDGGFRNRQDVRESIVRSDSQGAQGLCKHGLAGLNACQIRQNFYCIDRSTFGWLPSRYKLGLNYGLLPDYLDPRKLKPNTSFESRFASV